VLYCANLIYRNNLILGNVTIFVPNIELDVHSDARLPNVFACSPTGYNNNLTVLIIAFSLNHSVFTLFHPGDILFQTMLTNSDVLLVPNTYIRSACHISKVALLPHKFTHPPPCCKWIRTFRKYCVMLPFSGITLQLNMVYITQLLPDLWWIDKLPYIAPWNPRLKIPLPS
jgi:hypothetical protein